MSTEMGSLADITTDTMLLSNWSPSDFPFLNNSLFRHNFDMNFYLNNASYIMNCPSAGPNNLGRYISMILYLVVCVIGLFGNSLVI